MTFRKHPPLGSVLRSKICPPKGGDTMWASMTAAYEGLSKNMQKFLSTLEGDMILVMVSKKAQLSQAEKSASRRL